MHDRYVFMQNAFLAAQHFGSARGLLGKFFDFRLVLTLFLKGHVEATLAICFILRNHNFCVFFRNIDFCDTSNVLMRLFIFTNCKYTNRCQQMLNISNVFMCFLNAPRNPCQALPPPYGPGEGP